MQNKKLLFLSLLAVILIFPSFVSAQMIIVTMVQNIANVLTTVATILIVIAFIIAGLLFLTATGDPGKIGTAKKMMYAGIAGTVMVILANVGMTLVRSALFQGQ
ncbi:MAG: hypothetical protein A2312_04385 [Candidatus Staskawiczbacteria bacterium RIFOXYB2_FULL_32_9]|uniref:Uncharacterized protein n=1 Tax=Candidatus Staskawiczbacteria bacterium RIFOXYD1_FULL_32_13 TaxID=1802234 RepID=A0A1G2JM35_9BACT|nr:MAG: hypothetical protein UR22_C0009G0011 [Parcubacteria group bacterium GW2011_GWC2_32_10]OGZ77475.1 MAG: hypothetical protein A2256_00930 [Candidatus Staskawiczbacteria bacterium RIFOXYA2_FULL_32_7]OGZ81860.1 MAG: hypothetical protein A2312_04385 [Candidatus Staskawiczbacteria bacterium RIFOXYB2_FULL_32_9]OGZ85313.1 MAG: hypothetical protein A2463_00815 [Candidatus Staskawiczbacteria bacterium RIFOXYC2_FULL_32_10]OGZ87521.1 MAG: hypothetical protein A2561_00840 [Candidatus Staskawiczbacter